MALLFFKSILLPSSHRTGIGYRSVPPESPTMDPERISSSDSWSDAGMNEKLAYPEKQFFWRKRINPRIISDATIGLSDGLTVPFALTAGLSALGDTKIVVYGGLAELIAGGISMGLGGYLGAKSEAEGYQAALSETKDIVANDSQKAASMVRGTFNKYDFPDEALSSMASSLLSQPDQLVDFLMHFHHSLAEADYASSRAYISGLTISLGYFFGGLIPLLPYLFVASVSEAFLGSVIVMGIALFIFGWVKTSLVGESSRWICAKNGVSMIAMGGIAAMAAMTCVKTIGG